MSHVETSANPQVQKSNGWAHFWETLVLLGVTLMVCGYLVLYPGPYFWPWTAGCLIASVASFLAGIVCSRKALMTYESTKFRISYQTLRTLAAIDAPRDLIDCLLPLEGYTGENEEALFAKLGEALGPERCSELKNTVVKYTRVT